MANEVEISWGVGSINSPDFPVVIMSRLPGRLLATVASLARPASSKT